MGMAMDVKETYEFQNAIKPWIRKAIWTHFEKLENFRKAFPTTERIQ
jgi:hypothetical protein